MSHTSAPTYEPHFVIRNVPMSWEESVSITARYALVTALVVSVIHKEDYVLILGLIALSASTDLFTRYLLNKIPISVENTKTNICSKALGTGLAVFTVLANIDNFYRSFTDIQSKSTLVPLTQIVSVTYLTMKLFYTCIEYRKVKSRWFEATLYDGATACPNYVTHAAFDQNGRLHLHVTKVD